MSPTLLRSSRPRPLARGRDRLAGCVLAGLLASAAAAQGGDDQAGWAGMFRATASPASAAPVMLMGGAPPLIGATADVRVAAPGYSQGLLLVGVSSSSGVVLPLGPESLQLYVQPVVALPLPLGPGGGGLMLPVPPDPRSVGADLALQAIVHDPATGHFAASNLLLGNVGQVLFGGRMAFDFTYAGQAPRERTNRRGVVISGDVLDGEGRPMQVFCNSSGAADVTFQVELTKSPKSDIEIRTGPQGTGAVIGSITQEKQAVRVAVPAGTPAAPTYVYFHNTDRNGGVGLKWSLSVD